MRVLAIILLVCLCIGPAEPFSFNSIISWIISIFGTAVDELRNKVCTYLGQHPDRAATTVDAIKNALQKTNATQQTFVLTINYLSSASNFQKLTNSASTCTTYFNELYDAYKTDLQNKNVTSANAQDSARNFIKTVLEDLKKRFS